MEIFEGDLEDRLSQEWESLSGLDSGIGTYSEVSTASSAQEER